MAGGGGGRGGGGVRGLWGFRGFGGSVRVEPPAACGGPPAPRAAPHLELGCGCEPWVTGLWGFRGCGASVRVELPTTCGGRPAPRAALRRPHLELGAGLGQHDRHGRHRRRLDDHALLCTAGAAWCAGAGGPGAHGGGAGWGGGARGGARVHGRGFGRVVDRALLEERRMGREAAPPWRKPSQPLKRAGSGPNSWDPEITDRHRTLPRGSRARAFIPPS